MCHILLFFRLPLSIVPRAGADADAGAADDDIGSGGGGGKA